MLFYPRQFFKQTRVLTSDREDNTVHFPCGELAVLKQLHTSEKGVNVVTVDDKLNDPEFIPKVHVIMKQ